MRTLLRKVTTGLYFQGPDRWTANPAEGLNFKSIDHALKFVRTYDLKDVELAFAFKDSPVITHAAVEKVDVDFSE